MAKKPFAQLTPKQLRILTLIRDYRYKHGYSPTMQELADVLGVTKVTVFEHVAVLVKKGLLLRSKHRARSSELTDLGISVFPDESRTSFPLAGHIAAGVPIEAIEDGERVDLEDLFTRRQKTYLLKVRGDSMIDEQIRDGDLVVVEERKTAHNGETVVALLENGEATLKKFYREKKRIRLQPANDAYEPIYVNDVHIQGVVIGVLRTY